MSSYIQIPNEIANRGWFFDVNGYQWVKVDKQPVHNQKVISSSGRVGITNAEAATAYY